MEWSVLVQRQQIVEPFLPQFCHGQPQHGQEDEHAGEVETLARAPCQHQAPVTWPVHIHRPTVLHEPADKQAQVEQPEEDVEEDELGVVPDIREWRLPRDGDTEQVMDSLNDSLWFWWHQPPVNTDGEVFQKSLVFAHLRLETGVCDAGLVAGGRVLVQGPCQLLHALLVEAHPILVHAGAHDVLQLGLLDEAVTWNVLGMKRIVN